MSLPAWSALILAILAQASMAGTGNDDFIHRKKLASQESIEESLASIPPASYEALDPMRRSSPSYGADWTDGSLWWEWTAPRDGWFLVSTGTGRPSEVLETLVFTGEQLDRLVPVRNGNDNGPAHDWKTFFEARAGTRYQIAVRTLMPLIPPRDPSLATLRITPCPPPPANDTIERRAILSGPLPITRSVSNAGEPSRELPLLNSMTQIGDWYSFSSGDGPAQWWEWTCPESGSYVLRMEGGYWLFALAAQRRMITAGVPAPAGDWVPNGVVADGAGFIATAGVVYDLAVRTSRNTFGPYTLILDKGDTSLPPNRTRDTAAEMPAVLPSIAPFSWTRSEGPAQDGEEQPFWWAFTAPVEGLYDFFNVGYSMTLHHEPGRVHSASMFQYLQAGERVWIEFKVPRFAGAGMDKVVSFDVSVLLAGTVPANDMLADAVDLGSQTELRFTGDRRFATLEPGERAPLSGEGRVSGSLWWKWTAPADGWLKHAYILRHAPLEILTGTDTAAGELRASSQYGAPGIPVQGSQTYLLRILFSDGPDGEHCAMNLLFLPRPGNLTWQTALDLGVVAEPSWKPKNPTNGADAGSAQWFKWTAAESGKYDMFWRLQPFTLYSDPAAGIEVPRNEITGTWDFQAGQTYWLKYGTGKYDDSFAIAREELAEHGDINTAFILNPELPAAGTANARGDVNSPAEHQALLQQIPWLNRSNKGMIWWKWTAPKNQAVRCRVADFYNQMEDLFIFSGSTPEDEVIVYSSVWDREGKYFSAAQGTTYWFALTPRGESTARALLYRLELWPGEIEAPANDAFAHSVELSQEDWEDRNPIPAIHRLGGGPNPWRYELILATLESGEPPLTPVFTENGEAIVQTGSTWWHWTAPRDGVYKLVLLMSPSGEAGFPGEDVTLSIFTGTILASLEPAVMHRPKRGEYLFRAQRGVRYSIRAASGELTESFGLRATDPGQLELYNFRAIERGEFDLIGFANFIDGSDGVTNLRKVLFGMDPHYDVDHPQNAAARANLPRQVLRDGMLEMRCRPDPSMLPEGHPAAWALYGDTSDDLISWEGLLPEESADGELILRVPLNGRHRYLKWDVLRR